MAVVHRTISSASRPSRWASSVRRWLFVQGWVDSRTFDRGLGR